MPYFGQIEYPSQTPTAPGKGQEKEGTPPPPLPLLLQPHEVKQVRPKMTHLPPPKQRVYTSSALGFSETDDLTGRRVPQSLPRAKSKACPESAEGGPDFETWETANLHCDNFGSSAHDVSGRPAAIQQVFHRGMQLCSNRRFTLCRRKPHRTSPCLLFSTRPSHGWPWAARARRIA